MNIPSPLNCPFCGHVAMHTIADHTTRQPDIVHCTECFATIESDFVPLSALEKWNRRAATHGTLPHTPANGIRQVLIVKTTEIVLCECTFEEAEKIVQALELSCFWGADLIHPYLYPGA